jgi:hypothetical protein
VAEKPSIANTISNAFIFIIAGPLVGCFAGFVLSGASAYAPDDLVLWRVTQ